MHRIASMMKDIDELSRYIDILIHRYLVHAYHIRVIDRVLQLFAYRYNTFTTCSNPHCIAVSNTTVVVKSSSFIPSLPIIHHYPTNFSFSPIIYLYSALPPTSIISHHIIPPEDIVWLSFFGYLLTLLFFLSAHYFFLSRKVSLLTLFLKQTSYTIISPLSYPRLLYLNI